MSPFLTDDEIAEVCAPLKQHSAQRRFLEGLGMIVRAKPNGRPLVARGEFDRVLVGRQPDAQNASAQPNRAALMKVIQGGRRGTQTQGQ